MRQLIAAIAAIATAASPLLLSAQDNPVSLGYFSRVAPADVPEFEEAVADHAEWHADQDDPTTWAFWQALSGPLGEYVFIGTMDWSTLDDPPVDPAADGANWSETGGEYVESQEMRMWTAIADSGNPPAGFEHPIAQVFDFEVQPGGDYAMMQAIRMYKEAVDASGAPLAYEWYTVVSAEGPPMVFLVIWAESFAALGTPGPDPIDIIAEHFGAGEAAVLAESFSAAARLVSSQIWVLRPDLSYNLPM